VLAQPAAAAAAGDMNCSMPSSARISTDPSASTRSEDAPWGLQSSALPAACTVTIHGRAIAALHDLRGRRIPREHVIPLRVAITS